MRVYDFDPGDLVVNPSNREWGIGQVQSIVEDKVTVNFQNVGKKTINTQNIVLEKYNEKINPEILIKKLIPIIYKAGALSIKYSKKLKIFIKDDGTPVTNGDLKVDKILQNYLKKITPKLKLFLKKL